MSPNLEILNNTINSKLTQIVKKTIRFATFVTPSRLSRLIDLNEFLVWR